MISGLVPLCFTPQIFAANSPEAGRNSHQDSGNRGRGLATATKSAIGENALGPLAKTAGQRSALIFEANCPIGHNFWNRQFWNGSKAVRYRKKALTRR
jgi:hypothetical protein